MLREFLHSKWQYWSNSRANRLPASFPVNICTGSISMWDENLFLEVPVWEKYLGNTTV